MTYRIILFISVALLLGGCVTFREAHLFKDNTPGIPNYYKLHISGYSLFGKTKFVSGYFDEKAVEEYFGEFDQPDNYNFVKAETLDSVNGEEKETELVGELKNKKLVMILSTNSKAVSDQIGAIAENQQLNATFMAMASKEQLLDYQRAKMEVKQAADGSSATIGSVEGLISKLSKEEPEKNKAYLLAAVNILLTSLDEQPIEELAELSDKLKTLQK